MKKLITIIAVCMLSFATAAHADYKQQLSINGQTMEKAAVRLTFSDDQVVITFADGSDMTADMESVVLSFTPSVPTDIQQLRQPVGDTMDVDGLQPGTEVQVYDAKGRLVLKARADDARTLLTTKQLRSGVYMMRAGKQIVKFVKR